MVRPMPKLKLLAKQDPYPSLRFCHTCGWMKGGRDSWNGRACKCGFTFARKVL